MNYIMIGKIVNTHGIKGELRLISDFKYKDKVFKKNFIIFIGKDKIKEKIVSYRKHKQFDMICLEGYTNINEVLKYKGLYVFINKNDLQLDSNCYLNDDLIGLDVFVDNNKIGKIDNIERNGKKELFVITTQGREYLVPYESFFIKKIDIDNNRMDINNIKGLFD